MKKIFKLALKNFSKHEIPMYGAAFAYTAILSLPALLLTILFVTKIFLRDSEQIRSAVESFAASLPGTSGDSLVQFMNNSVEITGIWTGIATILLLFFGGTKLIVYFTLAINNCFGLKISKKKSSLFTTLMSRLKGLFFIFFFLLVIFTSLILGTALNGFFKNSYLFFLTNFLLSFGAYTLLYTFLLKFMVLIKIETKVAFAGGAFVSFLTVIGIAAITFILNQFDLTSDFAIGASLMLFLIWINYLSIIIFFGFECVNAYMREKGLLEIRELADEKYKQDIVVKTPLLAKMKGAFGVLKAESKIAKWFIKNKKN